MPLNPDIRDAAYQFFIEEAPDLLQVIEAGLLTFSQEHGTAKVHDLMRAAHSIKGGAASVELDAIAAIAHRLETIFKALYSDTLDFDTDLESQLLQAFDCLRLPLIEQIEGGDFDAEHALAIAEPIFVQLEERLGDAIAQAESYIPSSDELGVDMTQSLFEVDVQEGLERLKQVIANPSNYEVAGEVRAQAEVFVGFAELLNQPGFGAIATTTLAALDACPEQALVIAQLALTDFQHYREAVLAGTISTQSLAPSATLVAFANSTAPGVQDLSDISTVDAIAQLELSMEETEDSVPSLDDIFGSTPVTPTLAEEVKPEELFARLEALDTSDAEILEVEWVADATWTTEEMAETPLSLEDVFGTTEVTSETEVKTPPSLEDVFASAEGTSETKAEQEPHNRQLKVESPNLQPLRFETLEATVQSIEHVFNSLPPFQNLPVPAVQSNSLAEVAGLEGQQSIVSAKPDALELKLSSPASPASSTLSVRVDLERLERMNNLVGELAINRNGLSLQNEQLQGSVRELLARFARVQNMVGDLRKLSDQMIVGASSSGLMASHPQFLSALGSRGLEELNVGQLNGERSQENLQPSTFQPSHLQPFNLPTFNPLTSNLQPATFDGHHFDALELDTYGTLHLRLQGLLEDMTQLEEAVDDIVLFAKATDRTLEQQRQMLTQLRDELMWARMLPLGEVLNRFPRLLRDLSISYRKPANLKLNGMGVLVDKAVLEKLYDPLLHLLRNAFDHGIEPPEIRRQRGKPEDGQIEIKAYHRGSQTIIEVKDDGQGLNAERIGRRAVELGWLSTEQLASISQKQLFELLFEPGFSTAKHVSELSGRGVGLDVVRSQIRSLKGVITVNSTLGKGTTFTLCLPLTLSVAKLLVCFAGPTAVALPSDSIEEIVIPKADQIKKSGMQQFLNWRGQLVPTYKLADFLTYSCPLPDTSPSKALIAVPTPEHWAMPMLVLKQGHYVFALEIDRLVTEQELVIKPFGDAIASPKCTYGCTILGDGSLIPVIDAVVLLEQLLEKSTTSTSSVDRQHTTESLEVSVTPEHSSGETGWNNTNRISQRINPVKLTPTVLVVDDAVALRRTLALTLERAGYRVLQARDGQEALERLHQSSSIDLVVCDIEMPNMNGFEFLNQRRQDAELSQIPVVMLTSRSNDKHRWFAMQLGATAYFTKPYLEREFVAAIKTIITQSRAENLSVQS